MLHFPKGFRVPRPYRHPHFWLLPHHAVPGRGGFVAILRGGISSISCFRPDDVWPSANFSLSQHEADLEWQHAEFLAKRSFALWPLEPGQGAPLLGRGLPLSVGAAGGAGGALLLEGGRGAAH